MSLAICQGALDRAARYVQERQQFGRRIVDFQLVQATLADMVVQTEAARLLLYRAAANAGHGMPDALETSVAKCFANEAAKRVSDSAVQLLGGYGYTDEYEVERLHRDAHGWAIAGGTPTMQRIRIVSGVPWPPFRPAPPADGMIATAAQRVTDAIRQMIAAGEILPGRPGSTSGQLSFKLGVSRSPLREALRTLEAEGLMVHEPGRGYLVSRLNGEELRQVYLVRRLLGPAVLRSLPHAEHNEIADLEAANEAVAAADSMGAILSANRRFHFSIFALSPLDVVVGQIKRVWRLSEPYQGAYLLRPETRIISSASTPR